MKLSPMLTPLALALVVASCAPPAPDVAEVRKSIESMTEAMEQELESGAVDTAMARYADDPVSMPNFGPILRGKEAIKAHYHKMMEMGMTMKDVDFTVTDVMVSGMYAYEIGTYRMTVVMPGMGDMPDEGKYLTVWQQVPGGSWKIKVETWNTNIQPPMPGAEG